MNCAECKEILFACVEGLLDESQKRAVESHLRDCPACRAEAGELASLRSRLLKNGKAIAQTELEDRVMDRILREQSLKLKKAVKLEKQFQLWRIIMKSRITKLAAAAAIIVIAALSITLMEEATPRAYALTHTIEANHSVRYLHIKSFKVDEDEPKEFWVECDEFGQIKNVRMHMPGWDSPEDGAKLIVWKENRAQVYLKKKNVLATVRDRRVAAELLKFIEECDPRLAVERLYEREAQGKVKLDINEPPDKAEPIVVTATYLPESSTPDRRAVLFVDQATKLVTAIELYQLKDGEYQYMGVEEYYDYNQPMEAETFTLDETLIPADVMRIDQTTQEVGLVQGDLTDDEIAVEVARQFFEALIAEDYARAGQLFSGVPAAKMQEWFKKLNVVRIISIGEPVPHPVPGVGGFQVPCKVEIEKDGVKSIWESRPAVRPVYGQPERWNIHGGV